jgi:recombinational DNA repair protein (RecF pathway)
MTDKHKRPPYEIALMYDHILRLEEERKRNEEKYERLNNELNKNFIEKEKLHLIIDRLLEASGYDTNTASAKEFEDVYKNMRYEKQQLEQFKIENKKLKEKMNKLLDKSNKYLDKWGINFIYKQTLEDIKEIVQFGYRPYKFCGEHNNCCDVLNKIWNIISEVEND